MKKQLNYLIRYGQWATRCLFLLSLTLCATKCLSQSTTKQDSTCICGSQKDIDSTLKILNDYPDLLNESNLLKRALTNTKTLNAQEQATILKVLNMTLWNEKKVVWQIRKYKFMRPFFWALVSVSVGMVIGISKY